MGGAGPPSSLDPARRSGRHGGVIATEIDGISFNPNDLTFGPDSRLYFTDSGAWDPAAKPHPGYIFALGPDGTGEVLAELEPVYPNGIVAEPDSSVVWVESYTLMVRRRHPDGTIEDLCRLPEGHIPDGFKIATNGDFWITATSSGCVDIVSRDGELREPVRTNGVPLNCIFDGQGNLFVCDFGTADTSGASLGGRLLRIPVAEKGMPLFRRAIG